VSQLTILRTRRPCDHRGLEPALARRHRRLGTHSREQAFIAALLTKADGQADLPRLVEQILRPPFDRVA
jgi:hypothetical protein